MKVTNNGFSTFTVRDKRGNIIFLESKQSVEIEDSLGYKLQKVKAYDFLSFEEKKEPVKVEVKAEPKEEVKEVKEVKVSRETKKKKGKK